MASVNSVVPNRRGIPPLGGISWVQGRNFNFIVKLRILCKCCTFFSVDVGSFNWLYHFVYGYLALSVPRVPLFLQFFKSLQSHKSPEDWARQLFKPSTDSASLKLQVKNFFSFSILGFLKETSQWGHVFEIFSNLSGPGRQPNEPYFWLKFFFKLGPRTKVMAHCCNG